MFKNTNFNIALFDIKLNSPHKDLILVKGNENECDPIPFEGSIKLSIPQDIHVKRMKLCLTGEHNVDYYDRTPNGMISEPIYDRLCVLRVEWSNLLTSDEGEIKFGNYGDKFIKMSKIHDLGKKPHSKHSFSGKGHKLSLSISASANEGNKSVPSSLERPSYLRAKSHLSLERVGSAGSLVKLPKSGVDGTPFKQHHGSTNNDYVLPKGNYKIPFKCFLPANTPETVEGLRCCSLLYKLECVIERGRFEKSFHTAKHIRILRTLHPDNLSLSDSINIDNNWPDKVQYSVGINKKAIAIGSTIPVNLLIVPIAKGLKLKAMNGVLVQRFHSSHSSGVSSEFEQLIGKQSMPIPDPNSLPIDRWNVKSSFKVPSSLKELTQGCELKNSFIQVRHRLRIAVQLKNKDGHVSELRANLPVCIYISANAGSAVGRKFEITAHGDFHALSDSQEVLFKKVRNETSISSNPQSPELSAENEDDEEIDENDLDRTESAPPLYHHHVFDKIFDISSPQSPLEQLRMQSNNSTPINSLPGSMVNITSYFDLPTNNNAIGSPVMSPSFDVTSLSKVPSYSQAIDDDDNDDENEPAPTYDDQDKNSPYSTNTIPIPIQKGFGLHSRTPSLLNKSLLSLNLPKSRRTSPSQSLSVSPQPVTPSPGSPNHSNQSTPIKGQHNIKLSTKFLHKRKK